ncbi:MAG: hypothetical protein JXA10_02100 [Anaerolineae bacterium]|nr:hypothetical protein [Anaerolineae bacterium]
MRSINIVLGAMVFGAVLVGCGGNAQPSIVVFQPSITPTITETPTITPVPGQPVGAVTVAETVEPTATIPPPTRPPTTPTPGPSPTNLVAPTFTPAPVTLTATSVPIRSSLAVEYFTTDTEVVKPGDNVTLFWSVRGAAAAQIYRVSAENERIWRWDVNTAGKITVATRVEDRDVARFLLVGQGRGGEVEQPLLIPVECSEAWFFDPPPDTCPGASPSLSTQAEQTFEHGRMIWVAAQDRIYVVFDDGLTPTWAQYPDEFTEDDPDLDETLVAPPGLQQPVRGFGLIWRSNPRVQDRLGWATTPEVAFEGMFQADSIELSVATLYLRARDGGIIALDALNDKWTILPAISNISTGTGATNSTTGNGEAPPSN